MTAPMALARLPLKGASPATGETSFAAIAGWFCSVAIG